MIQYVIKLSSAELYCSCCRQQSSSNCYCDRVHNLHASLYRPRTIVYLHGWWCHLSSKFIWYVRTHPSGVVIFHKLTTILFEYLRSWKTCLKKSSSEISERQYNEIKTTIKIIIALNIIAIVVQCCGTHTTPCSYTARLYVFCMATHRQNRGNEAGSRLLLQLPMLLTDVTNFYDIVKY